jgi:hypothetical protein
MLSRFTLISVLVPVWVALAAVGAAGQSAQRAAVDSCSQLISDAEHARSRQEAYDDYRHYIESCYYQPNSWEFFMNVAEQNAYRNEDSHRFEECRDWLKKVLYLSPDTNYYCADVNAILLTLHWFDDTRGNDYRGALAIVKFLVETNRCPQSTARFDTVTIPATWAALHHAWMDTVFDPNLTPFDSTLPTLEDLGLGILRGNPADVKYFIDSKLGPMITVIGAMPNPFTDETRIDFSCREAVAVRFEVFDVLGERVFDGGEKVYSEGENRVTLLAAGLPHGILYARFSASDGSVKTIKLRHAE